MRFKGLDVNQLVTLETLLVERNLTRASERLNLTQPAVSNALTKLREYFEDPLLLRQGRMMRPTPFADHLLPRLQDALKRIREIATARPHFDALTATRLYRIVASDYITTVLLTRLMLEVSVQAPKVRFEVLPINDENIGRFSRGDADALIQPDTDTFPWPSKRQLFTERFVCIAGSRNKQVPDSLSMEQFYALPRVIPSHRRYWPDERIAHADAPPPIAMPFTVIPMFVASGHHVALVPDRLAEFFLPLLPLRRVPLTDPAPPVSITVKWHGASHADPFHGWMLAQIASAAEAPRTPRPAPPRMQHRR